jgi:arsenate reductase (thioredoxin)
MLSFPMMKADGCTQMDQKALVVFVCEHGAAKSILAAAYFNKLAAEASLSAHAIARGTNPDQELSPKTVEGLRCDGLTSAESTPQKLTLAEIESAAQIISFCELPAEFQNKNNIIQWSDVPSVSENYETARGVIVQYIRRFLKLE